MQGQEPEMQEPEMQEPEMQEPEMQEPEMQEPVAQSLDPALVRRLRRPAERPGVIDPGPAQAMLARHQRMVTGWPLAELVARHTGSTLDPVGTVPIVYALPAQPPPADSPSKHISGGPSGPIVAGVPARPAAPSAVPIVCEATPTPVVQRKVDAQAPPVSRTPPDLASPNPLGSPNPLVSLDHLASPNQMARPDQMARPELWSPTARRPADPLPAATAPGPTPPQPRRPTAAGLPRVVPASPGGAPGAVRAAAGGTPIGAPLSSMPLPLLRIRPDGTRSQDTTRNGHHVRGGAVPLVVAAPVSLRAGERAAQVAVHGPAVQARSAATNSGHRPLREPLLLVDLAAATSRSAEHRPGSAEHRPGSAERGVPVTGRAARTPVPDGAARAARSPDGSARPHRPPAAEIDVEHIVDTVHRRFVRRLAIEAERRAVR